MKYLLILFPLLYQTAALAQDTPPRCFKAYDAPVGGNEVSVFCVGQQVYFRDCAGIDADKEYYDYDSSNGLDFNTPEARAKSFTFTRPGTYTVTQFGNLDGENATYARQFVVKAIAAPAFTAEVCSGQTVKVTVTDQTYARYSLSFGDGTSAVEITSGQETPHTYAINGTYTLTLTGRHNQANCETTPATKSITTLPALPEPQLAELTLVSKGTTDGVAQFVFNQLDPNFTYFLEEISSSQALISSEPVQGVQQAGTMTLTKQHLNTNQPRCYRIRATDACGTEQVSPTVCTVVLTASALAEEQILLEWLTAVGAPGSANQFIVEVLGLQNNVISTIPVTGNTYTHNPAALNEPVLRYRIKATSGNGNYVSYSNTEVVPQPVRLYVPSGFTPNGDGLNDVFEVKGKFYQDFSIRIYNHLGQVVYTSADATTGWDGTYRGKPLPQAAYVYEINVKAADGTSRTRTGTVTLIR
ncbi:T9SS type B sorting domain-containing protein [Botryobacter ruber]|uniref:T9SS type B sorting domain-containing protein n=1 Tax=Botryobacter ruber TaxID=2171629 RepID=UPI0013E330C9|nr:gliding motility-associated C-terminal domain-containing protein [Botryobacter ruber]